jgi:hypothetical protein
MVHEQLGAPSRHAPAHTALAVQQFLASKYMMVVPHPPHLPDLAPCDFFLFPKMKIKLNGQALTL